MSLGRRAAAPDQRTPALAGDLRRGGARCRRPPDGRRAHERRPRGCDSHECGCALPPAARARGQSASSTRTRGGSSRWRRSARRSARTLRTPSPRLRCTWAAVRATRRGPRSSTAPYRRERVPRSFTGRASGSTGHERPEDNAIFDRYIAVRHAAQHASTARRLRLRALRDDRRRRRRQRDVALAAPRGASDGPRDRLRPAPRCRRARSRRRPRGRGRQLLRVRAGGRGCVCPEVDPP